MFGPVVKYAALAFAAVLAACQSSQPTQSVEVVPGFARFDETHRQGYFELSANYVRDDTIACNPMFNNADFGSEDFCIVVNSGLAEPGQVITIAYADDGEQLGDRVGLDGPIGTPVVLSYPDIRRHLLVLCESDGECTVQRIYSDTRSVAFTNTQGTLYFRGNAVAAMRPLGDACEVVGGRPSGEDIGDFFGQRDARMLIQNGAQAMIQGFGRVECFVEDTGSQGLRGGLDYV